MKKAILFTIIGTVVLGAILWLAFEEKIVEEKVSATSPDSGSVTSGLFVTYDFFNSSTTGMGLTATTTSATSSERTLTEITAAKRATIWFERSGEFGNEGTSTFHLEVSRTGSTSPNSNLDDLEWIDYNKLIDNIVNATANNPTRVTEVALTGTSTKMYSMDLTSDIIKYVRCIVVEATDGQHGCKLITQY